MRTFFLGLFLMGQACFAQNHSLRASVRPNDSVKYNASLPWVSEYTQPAVYAEWWKEVAICEHFIYPGDLTTAVHFVQVNSRTFRKGLMPETLYGSADVGSLTIYLAQSAVLNRSIVMHEMAHQYAYWLGIDEGEDYHPPDLFEVCELHTSYP